jgi:hypothetical protein
MAEIEAALADLAAVLARDPRCRWTAHFAHGLAWCRDLRARLEPPAADEIAAFRRWLLGPYRGGAGQFNDYVPVVQAAEPGAWVTAPWDTKVCVARDRLADVAGRLGS